MPNIIHPAHPHDPMRDQPEERGLAFSTGRLPQAD
jgi:hypothetical protein